MSTKGITTGSGAQAAYLPSAANEFVTALNRLANDLQSGDLAAVQTDYVLFSESVLNSGESVPESAAVTDPSAAEANPATPQAAQPAPVEPTGQSPAPTPVAADPGSAGPAPSLNIQV